MEENKLNQIIENFLKNLKGEKGEIGDKGATPKMGEDYLTESEIQELIDLIYTQVKSKIEIPEIGKNYFTPEEYQLILESVEKNIKYPKDGKDGKDAIVDYNKIISQIMSKVKIPKDGKDGSPDTGKEIVEKLTKLPEEERLSWKYLKDKPDLGKNNGGNGIGYIREASDVNIPTVPTDGQVLTYNGTGKYWEAETPSESSGKAYATYSVGATNSDYTDIQSALDAIGASGGTIFVQDGTYTITSTLLIKTSNTRLIMSGGAIVQGNGATLGTMIKADTTGLNRILVDGGKWLNSSANGTGTCFDVSDISDSVFSPTRIEEFSIGIKQDDTTSVTFYNRFYNTQIFNCITCVQIGVTSTSTQPNANQFYSIRAKPKNGGGGYAYRIADARGLSFYGCDAEPSSAGSITGWSFEQNATSLGYARDITVIGTWTEGNFVGVNINAGCSRISFIGGTLSANTTDFIDNGNDTVFMATNRSGATLGATTKFLFNDYATVGNTTTTETDLYSHSIASTVFTANGMGLNATFGGNYVAHATATRQLRMYFGGTLIYDSSAVATTSAADWALTVNIIRETSTVVRCTVTATTTSVLTGYVLARYTRVTGLTLSGANILKITGQAGGVGAATNDINARMAVSTTNIYA